VTHAARRDPALKTISSQPGTARFGSFTFGHNGVPNIATAVSRYLIRASVEEPGAVPLLATYRVVHGLCGHASDSRADVASYKGLHRRVREGHRLLPRGAVPRDGLDITMPCLSRHGQAVREHELQYAIDTLTANCPHLVIYLDAGAADALSAKQAPGTCGVRAPRDPGLLPQRHPFRLDRERDPVRREDLGPYGGQAFVVNTGTNGRGPLRLTDIVHEGNEVLCNPPGRGLVPRLTADTGFPNVDMFAWTTNPGESGGPCRPGAPKTGVFWPAYALMLVRNADFNSR
jgi:endoglucanase